MILIVDSKHYSNFAALAHHKTGFWIKCYHNTTNSQNQVTKLTWSSVYHDQIFFLKEVQ
jgi:hypothetical protein